MMIHMAGYMKQYYQATVVVALQIRLHDTHMFHSGSYQKVPKILQTDAKTNFRFKK